MPWHGYKLKPWGNCLVVPYNMVQAGMVESDVSFKR